MSTCFRTALVFISLLLLLAAPVLPVSATSPHDSYWSSQPKDFDCATVTDIPLTECQALVALYNSTNGAGWTNSTNWLAATTAGNWYGVTVSGGHVIRIDLLYNNLFGAIPVELGNLYNLQYLELGYNLLSGTIPPELGNLPILTRLSLYNNQLTGSIPPELGNLTNLQSLVLFYNQLSGPIPSEIGNLMNLDFLNLYGNKLSGAIPSELGNLANLWYLSLSFNQLSGAIPSSMGNLTNLQRLYLTSNQLSGAIPPEFGNLTQLSQLLLDYNQLSGAVPTSLGYLTNIFVLKLNNNSLSGDLPVSFTNLVNLCLPSDTWNPCNFGEYGLNLGYNRLTVPATPQALVDFLDLKNPGWELTQAVSETIDETGGEITSNDGDTTLTFPVGSVPQETVITFVPQPGPSTETGLLSFANSSFLVEVLAVGKFDFAQPITVSLTYADTDLGTLPWLLAESSLTLYWWSGSAWVDAATTCTVPSDYVRDPAANTLQLSICKSGEFALLGTHQPMIFLPIVRR